MALEALASLNRQLECCHLVAEALHVVRPVPTALWVWACDHPRLLGSSTLRAVLREAAADRRLGRHLEDARRRDRLASTPDGLAALMHEQHLFPGWAPELVRQAADRLMTTWQRTTSLSDDPNIYNSHGWP